MRSALRRLWNAFFAGIGHFDMSDAGLSGRHALVCGASSGIGRASALALAAKGAALTVLARRAERLDALLDELKSAGAPSAQALVLSLDDRQQLAAAMDSLLEHGPVISSFTTQEVHPAVPSFGIEPIYCVFVVMWPVPSCWFETLPGMGGCVLRSIHSDRLDVRSRARPWAGLSNIIRAR